MERKDLYLVYLGEFTARFCTWAIISQLLMHLISVHWGDSSKQLYIVGAAVSVLYMSTIFGGLIRDWLLTGKFVVILGIGLIGIGNLSLLANHYFFFAGLGLALLGAGMVTPNTPLLLFSLTDNRSDKVFTILYGITNAGVILGAVLGGVMNEYISWESVLVLDEIVIVFWLAFCIFSTWLSSFKNLDKLKLVQLITALILLEYIVYFYLKFEVFSEILLIIAGVFYIGFLAFLMRKEKTIRKSLVSSFFLIILAIIFFSGEFQVASTLADYAKNFAKLSIAHMTIPAGSLLALESIFVIVGAFIIARVKLLAGITHVQTKVFIGLLLGTLAFIVLYGSTLIAVQHSISVLWIIFSFLLLGLGDVYLMPSIMAYVIEFAPPAYKGRLMAGMYFSLSLSGYFSGFIGSTLSKHFPNAHTNLCFYSTGFNVMVSILGVTTALVVIARLIGVTVYLKR